MKLNVHVSSSERVKPSSPTPPNLRRYDLSFLDQLAPPIYMPTILFFREMRRAPVHQNTNPVQCSPCSHLKSSLSEALSLFHPFAGTLIQSDLIVDCNDVGALFVEAETESTISELFEDFDGGEMNKLLAVEIDDVRVSEIPVAAMATFFRCGGVAISLCVNHKVADALTFFVFLNAWAAISRMERDVVRSPVFGAERIFPAREMCGYSANNSIVKNDIVVKRFVFDAKSIDELKIRYEDKTSLKYTRRPTRVEALSAFIWTRLTAVLKPKDAAAGGIFTMLHAVNLRPRTEPPLPENLFGNMSRIAISVPSPEPDENGNSTIVSRIRDSIAGVDADFTRKLREEEDHVGLLKQRLAQVKSGEVVSISFTSLCRCPIYEANFGWGEPGFVASARLSFKNLVSFFDAKSGGGIEAWVNLRKEDMARFEADPEILHASSSKSKSVILV